MEDVLYTFAHKGKESQRYLSDLKKDCNGEPYLDMPGQHHATNATDLTQLNNHVNSDIVLLSIEVVTRGKRERY